MDEEAGQGVLAVKKSVATPIEHVHVWRVFALFVLAHPLRRKPPGLCFYVLKLFVVIMT